MTKKKIVKKHNQLITAQFHLKLAEYRLLLLAITLLDSKAPQSEITITIHDYAKAFNVTTQGAYKALDSITQELFKNKFFYYGDDGLLREAYWLSSRTVNQPELNEPRVRRSFVKLTFTPEAINLIYNLSEQFTYYEIKQIASLSTFYAVRLYELLIRWRSLGETPQLSLQDLRKQLGLEPEEYERMQHFKARVLDKSVEQINRLTDIKAEYTQVKEGREIKALTFKLEDKALAAARDFVGPPKPPEEEPPIKLTPKQRAYFAGLLSRLPAMGKYAVGQQSHAEFACWIEQKLKDKEMVEKWRPHLAAVGYEKAKQLPLALPG